MSDTCWENVLKIVVKADSRGEMLERLSEVVDKLRGGEDFGDQSSRQFEYEFELKDFVAR